MGNREINDAVRVTVSDNGKGFGEQPYRDVMRFGLIGMRERVQALHGEFRIDSAPGQGATVTVLIPVAAATGGPQG
jgi:signal transduction histidine kinase